MVEPGVWKTHLTRILGHGCGLTSVKCVDVDDISTVWAGPLTAALARAVGVPVGHREKRYPHSSFPLTLGKSKEAEIKRINKELANIRSKFKGDKALDGYSKKKYVCKLLFIFLLGHDIDFGHMEAVNLLSSNKYTEKQIVSVATCGFWFSDLSCQN